MATIELCDMCAGKAKSALSSISLRGKLPAFKGQAPELPQGFRYSDEVEKNKFGKMSYKKVWDEYGRIISETRYIERPKKWKEIEISYDLCELCFEKFIAMLESIKRQYHLEQTEVNLIEDKTWKNPFSLLGYNDDDE